MNRRTLISLLLAFALLAAPAAVRTTAVAEDYVPEILPVPAADGSLIDGDTLTAFFDQYLRENDCDHENQLLSIAMWYPGTGEYWFYNPDEWMYGVNWYRLPVSMYLAEKVASGELAMDTVVNGITLEYAVTTALEASSNPSASSMVIYLGDYSGANCADLTRGFADLPDSYFTDEYYHDNGYTARLMLEITKTLYLGGPERFPLVEESMKKSMPDDFFKRDWNVSHSWEIAQVHSAYWGEGAGDRINCTGIIYTSTPILVTVMMKNIADLDILGGVAWRAAHLAEALHARQHADDAPTPDAASVTPAVAQAPQEAQTPGPETSRPAPAEEAPAPTPPAAATPVPTPETQTAQPAETTAPTPETQTPQPAEPSSDARTSRPPFTLIFVIFLLFFLGVLAYAVTLIIREQRERKRRRRRSGRGRS